MILSQLAPLVSKLLSKVDEHGDINLTLLPSGGNNRVYLAQTNNIKYLVKLYFTHPDDPRNRLENEFKFMEFLWNNGIRCIPQPIIYDQEYMLGIYEFIEGNKIKPQELNHDYIDQALFFFDKINQLKNTPDADNLSSASESCFSLNDHLALVEKRVQMLSNIEIMDEIDKRANSIIESWLIPSWERVKDFFNGETIRLEMNVEEEISKNDRCISPSDFGFHNSLLCNDGEIRFIDFEYSGWDDPAKMVCDFFCQPSVPVPYAYYNYFSKSIASIFRESEINIKKFKMLLPVYKIKWLCIMLNEFLPAGAQRRLYANNSVDINDKKKEQLDKIIQQIQEDEIIQKFSVIS